MATHRKLKVGRSGDGQVVYMECFSIKLKGKDTTIARFYYNNNPIEYYQEIVAMFEPGLLKQPGEDSLQHCERLIKDWIDQHGEPNAVARVAMEVNHDTQRIRIGLLWLGRKSGCPGTGTPMRVRG